MVFAVQVNSIKVDRERTFGLRHEVQPLYEGSVGTDTSDGLLGQCCTAGGRAVSCGAWSEKTNKWSVRGSSCSYIMSQTIRGTFADGGFTRRRAAQSPDLDPSTQGEM